MTGIERIAEAFASARADGRRAALMPYLMGGYPGLDESRSVLAQYVEGGADLIELGIPFSDPLADGPVIHAAGVAALRAGARVEDALALAGVAGEAGVPVIVMCYANPIFVRGPERFADALVAASTSGLIVPDLPLEEGRKLVEACERRGIALIELVAPTTPEERMARIVSGARGFVYAVGGNLDTLPTKTP